MNDSIQRYRQALNFLNEGLIRQAVPVSSGKKTRREWMLEFLDDCQHPERSFPAVHVTGTSGKGSTALMIAEILRAAGYLTGFHPSPYLQVATEKFWCDGRYASAGEFADLVDWVRPIAAAWNRPDVPRHGLAAVAMTLEFFRRRRVEVGVVEVGVGGRDDITNVLNTIVGVITNIGLDHLKTLGPTRRDIAHHKAGILKPGIPAVISQGPGTEYILEALEPKGIQPRIIDFEQSCRKIELEFERSRFDFYGRRFQIAALEVPIPGKFQCYNAALAISAAECLVDQGYRIGETEIRQGLAQVRFPGRLEIIPAQPKVLLDGAHNQDKLRGLAQFIRPIRRQTRGRVIMLFGALESRNAAELVAEVVDVADTVIVTEPQVYGKPSHTASELARFFPAGKVHSCESDPNIALKTALALSQPDDLLVITGSLYLVGQLRGHWYPADEVLLQQNSFPPGQC
jgi:dihydrofolate synthase/folylpolyglutamate synthase